MDNRIEERKMEMDLSEFAAAPCSKNIYGNLKA
jgi:hypothetical protein